MGHRDENGNGIRIRQHPAAVGTPALHNGEACFLLQKEKGSPCFMHTHDPKIQFSRSDLGFLMQPGSQA